MKQVEMKVLGACLMDTEVALDVVSSLTVNHFTEDSLGAIFETMKDTIIKGLDINPASLMTKHDKNLVSAIVHAIDTSVYVKTHIKEMEDAYFARRMVQYFSKGVEIAKKGNSKEIQDHLSNVPQTAMEAIKHQTTREIAQLAIEDMAERRAGKDDLRGLRTGNKDLDSYTGGLKRGEVILITAEPKVGKSAFAMQVANYLANSGFRVDYFAYELTRRQLGTRLLSQLYDVSTAHTNRPKSMTDADILKLGEKKDPRAVDYLVLYDKLELKQKTVLEIRSKVRHQNVIRGDKPDLIVVDYVGLMAGPEVDPWKNDGNNISALVSLATELDVPIIAIQALTKDGKVKGDSSITYDVGQHWVLERDYENPAPEVASITDIKVKMNRDGESGGVVTAIYDNRYLLFRPSVEQGGVKWTSQPSDQSRKQNTYSGNTYKKGYPKR